MKITIKTYLLFFTLLIYLHGNTQSAPMYSQYLYNMTNINPAFAGSNEAPILTILRREQWIGVQGAPFTSSLSFETPSKSNKYGFGVQLFQDKYVSVLKRTGVGFSYNIKIKIADNGLLSLGLKAGFYNDIKLLSELNMGDYATYDATYSKNFNKTIPLAGAGIFYHDDKFFIGFSTPDVITFSKVQEYVSDSNIFQVNQTHYFLTAGYTTNFSDEIMFKPSFLIKANGGSPVQLDVTSNFWYKNLLGIGISYRTERSLLSMVQIQFRPRIKFGYAYDFPFKMIPNSHEIFFQLELNKLGLGR